MMNWIKTGIKSFLSLYIKRVCRGDYENQVFTRFNERPVEFGFVFSKLSEIFPKRVLDVGTGTTALPHLMSNCGFHVTAIDNIEDYWPAGMFNRHYHIINDDITNTSLKEKFDFVTCISVLEHVEKAGSAIKNMFNLLNDNGYLLLTFPYNENGYVRNVYELPGSSYGQDAPYITQSFSRQELNSWLKENKGKIVEQEFWKFWEGQYWTQEGQVIPPVKTGADAPHQLTCLLIQKEVVD